MNYHRLRILLVEDDEYHYVTTLALLAGIGTHAFELDWAPTFEAAQAAIATQAHDVYLIDYHLDMRYGLQLLQQAIGSGGTAPVLLMTGSGPSAADVAALKAGILESRRNDLSPPLSLVPTLHHGATPSVCSAPGQRSC